MVLLRNLQYSAPKISSFIKEPLNFHSQFCSCPIELRKVRGSVISQCTATSDVQVLLSLTILKKNYYYYLLFSVLNIPMDSATGL